MSDKPLTTVEIASDPKHAHHRNAQSQLTEGADLLQLILLPCEAEIRYNEEVYKRGGGDGARKKQ